MVQRMVGRVGIKTKQKQKVKKSSKSEITNIIPEDTNSNCIGACGPVTKVVLAK